MEDGLQIRKNFCEIANKLFGLNIMVEKAQVIEEAENMEEEENQNFYVANIMIEYQWIF